MSDPEDWYWRYKIHTAGGNEIICHGFFGTSVMTFWMPERDLKCLGLITSVIKYVSEKNQIRNIWLLNSTRSYFLVTYTRYLKTSKQNFIWGLSQLKEPSTQNSCSESALSYLITDLLLQSEVDIRDSALNPTSLQLLTEHKKYCNAKPITSVFFSSCYLVFHLLLC